MKDSLPANHGFPEQFLPLDTLLFRDDGELSITDIQWEALNNGVCRGENMLALAPTSTGKTQIGVWALASWLASDRAHHRAVYLVTHRSLANQKFEEFRQILLNPLFSDAQDAMVLSTGDRTVDAGGVAVDAPLDAGLLVATYEKYLGLLCSAGIPSDLQNTCIVADEVQILGDKYRGVNIEALLTMVRGANPGQFIGLSAVLRNEDGQTLADWLNVTLVRVPHREKHLVYECRTPSKQLLFRTEMQQRGVSETPLQSEMAMDILGLIRECMNAEEGKPIVVFCMRKQDVYDGCREYCKSMGLILDGAPLFGGLSADTPEAELLSATMPHRVTIHCADLIEDDRLRVEQAIQNREVDLIFATSTLAAGVNFPIGTVIFYKWERWNNERRHHEPIPAGEFHNMAGRCGRMGTDHESGRVIFLASDGYRDQSAVQNFLTPDHFDSLKSQIDPDYFTPLILQLTASSVIDSEDDGLEFLKTTFGAHRELRRNVAGLDHWDEPFGQSVTQLREWGFLR